MPRREHFDAGHGKTEHSLWYHGTGTRNVEGILSKGLIPHRPGEDEGLEDDDHPEGVYLTQNLDEAKEFGDNVFEVRLSPKEEKGMNYSYSNSHFAYPGVLPPHRLRLLGEDE